MQPLLLHDFHAAQGAAFFELNGFEAVSSYGHPIEEYEALTREAALVDLSFRSRICLLGTDREKFLHGQVTNDVLKLKVGQGCYATLVTAKGKIESDLFIHKVKDELLLDFEPGLTQRVIERLNRYVIAEDVQMVDVAPHYGLLFVGGPGSIEILKGSGLQLAIPETPLNWLSTTIDSEEIYIVNNPRFRSPGFDLFVPVARIEAIARGLLQDGAKLAGFNALETVRIENAVPRFGIDMTEITLPQEAELQERAISFAKGCYIGQEVIARIRTYGQVAKALRLLRLKDGNTAPPSGAKIFAAGKESGFVTSTTCSPKYKAHVALGYVRKESNAVGTQVELGSTPGPHAEIIAGNQPHAGSTSPQ
jgi:folate-binding protein YgfZ